MLGLCLLPFIIIGVIIYLIIKVLSKKKPSLPSQPSTQSSDTLLNNSPNKSVYLIEDEADAFNLFVDILEGEFEVQGNTNPQKALEELKGKYFDVIISGMVMPELAGIEVLEKLKNSEDYKFDKFIFLTNIGGDVAINKAMDMGVDGYLIKSDTSAEELINYLKSLFKEEPSHKEDIIYANNKTPAFNFSSISSLFSGTKSKPKEENWISQLEIPYKRWILNIKQCEEEVLRLFQDIAVFTDNYLQEKGTSLSQVKAKLDRSGGYYSNILYTLECIAEGEVEKYYRGRRGYDNSFSYQLLGEHIDNHIVSKLKDYISERVTQLPEPNENTISSLGLSPNGMPRLWWDADGKLRESLDLERDDYYWLEKMQYRSTKFLDIKQCRVETTKLYLSLLSQLEESKDSSILNNPAQKYLNNLFLRKDYYNESYSSFLKDIFKISENNVREVYPGNRSLNIENELGRIKKRIGAEGLKLVKRLVNKLKKKVSAPDEATLRILYGSNPNIWKSQFKEITKSIDNENHIRLFQEVNVALKMYRDSEVTPDILYFLSKKFAEYNKILSLYYYYKYLNTEKTPKDLGKKITKILYSNKTIEDGFKKLLSMNLNGNELIDALKDLYTPKRKEIKIDSKKVDLIKEKHSKTVDKLSEFIGEDEISLPDNLEDNKSGDSLDALFSIDEDADSPDFASELDSVQKSLLELFTKSNFKLKVDSVEAFAAKNNQLPKSLISRLNQTFYNSYEDNLITESNDNFAIEEEYISIIKNVTNGKSN